MSKGKNRKKRGNRTTEVTMNDSSFDPSSFDLSSRSGAMDAISNIAQRTQALQGIITNDAFQNEMSRMGFGQPNLLEGTQYPLTRMTYNYNLFNSLYRGSWIIRKIIDVVPSDMMKNWIKLKADVSPEEIKSFNQSIKKTKTRDKLLEGLRWGRLYGGAAALILIDGHSEILDTPLDLNMIMPGDYKGLLVFDRWSGVYPDIELIDDINDPDFGLPKYYNFYTVPQVDKAFKVHHSRVVRFTGRALPYWEKMAETQWGESEVEVVFEELKKRDNTSYNIAYLIFLANLRVLKIDDYGTVAATATETARKQLNDMIQAQNWLMSNMGIYVMDKEDDFDTKTYTFSGLNEVYESFQLDMAGAAEMPVTKLFGRAPAGMNATGESDLTNYDETIEEKQRAFLAPALDKLFPIVAMSSWGYVPDDFDWEFNPVRNISDKDRNDLAKTNTDNVVATYEAGLVSQKTALMELKKTSEITGVWTSISDEDIAAASTEVNQLNLDPVGVNPLENETDQITPVAEQSYTPGWMSRIFGRKRGENGTNYQS